MNEKMDYKVKISIKELGLWYGQNKVLEGVSMDVPEYRITALIGPSGCGKSSLLRSINRMNELIRHARTTGKVVYGGYDVNSGDVDVVALRKKIGMVFQKPNPFPMSIFENVAYGLRLQRMRDRKGIERIVHESLKKADLWDEVSGRLYDSAFSLSGGQQQRLCIARALAINPDVLLLDEPCSSLDPVATAKIEALLLKLKREMTIIIVTHNMHQAKRVSDYTCYLLNGRIIEHDDTEKIFSKPENRLTEQYIRGEFG